jgi:hypothetical protein
VFFLVLDSFAIATFIDENEEAVTRRLQSLIQFVQVGLTGSLSALHVGDPVGIFNDPHKAAEDFQAFAKLNEPIRRGRRK